MSILISPADIRRILDVCHPVCEATNRYPAIAGVGLSVDGDKLVAIGTDGRQLARVETGTVELSGSELESDFKASVDMKPLYAKRRGFKKTIHNPTVEMAVGFGVVIFSWYDAKQKKKEVTCEMIAGKFPNVDTLWPDEKNFVGSITVEPATWVEAFEEAVPVALGFSRVEEKVVRVEPTDWHRNLKVKDFEGDFDSTLDPELVIGHLSRLGDTSIGIKCFGAGLPIVIESLQTRYLLMPCQVMPTEK